MIALSPKVTMLIFSYLQTWQGERLKIPALRQSSGGGHVFRLT
jgi:hypothetical protein